MWGCILLSLLVLHLLHQGQVQRLESIEKDGRMSLEFDTLRFFRSEKHGTMRILS